MTEVITDHVATQAGIDNKKADTTILEQRKGPLSILSGEQIRRRF